MGHARLYQPLYSSETTSSSEKDPHHFLSQEAVFIGTGSLVLLSLLAWLTNHKKLSGLFAMLALITGSLGSINASYHSINPIELSPRHRLYKS